MIQLNCAFSGAIHRTCCFDAPIITRNLGQFYDSIEEIGGQGWGPCYFIPGLETFLDIFGSRFLQLGIKTFKLHRSVWEQIASPIWKGVTTFNQSCTVKLDCEDWGPQTPMICVILEISTVYLLFSAEILCLGR